MSRNILLCIETSVGPFSIALFNDDKLIDLYYHSTPHQQAEMLIPKINDMLDKNDISYSEIKNIAVSIGPGSFTGIRIGLSAAQGISIGNHCSIIGISTLEAIAQNSNSKKYLVALSAGRSQFYCQWFKNVNGIVSSDSDPMLLNSDDIQAEDSIIISEPLKSYPELSALNVGLSALSKGSSKTKIISPIYIRPADAKLPSKRINNNTDISSH